MRLLTVTTLYPNEAAPAHGVFVENRLDAWRRRSGGEARVIAPVPWFPFSASVFGRYARFAVAPPVETRRDIDIRHPRYFIPPKIGMNYAPTALAHVLEREARNLIETGWDFDLIDAHYLYPDGVAAVRVAKKIGKPAILTARGSDVTQLTAFPRQRAMILDAIHKADGVVVVAEALKAELIRRGAPAEKIEIMRNGVDLDRFRPLDRNRIRAGLALEGVVVASVGGLIARKGHDVAIRAIAQTPGATLLIVGDGKDRKRLEATAHDACVADRVRFLGAVAHEKLPEIYNAADALMLASTREGWPNVILEAMACGTPVIASSAGGCGEVIRSRDAGRIVDDRSGEAFAAALADMLAGSDRAAVRRYAEMHSWDETSDRLTALYARIIEKKNTPMRSAPAVLKRVEKPKLIFTIDTEETFDWNHFSPDDWRVERPAGLQRLQSLLEEFRIRPIYFLTCPIMTDAENAGFFRRLSEDGRADLGLHPHQWNTPPLGGFAGAYYSWQCNLPLDAQKTKLSALAEVFETAFGFRPIAHRAGRYGVDATAYRAIAAAGVRHDFSPSVAFDFSRDGGPDFSMMSNHPFIVETPEGRISVTPVCGARAIKGGRFFLDQETEPAGFPSNGGRRLSQLTAPLRLSCENASLSDLIALTRHLEKSGLPVLTYSLHSTSLTAGANSYARDGASVDAALTLTRRFLEFFTKDFHGDTTNLAALDDLYATRD